LIINFYHSTIGKKFAVALTGLAMFGFLIGHLAGNLQIFMGPAKINDYAQFLHENPPLVWGTRIAMLIAVVVHIIATIQLTARNKASRPIAYHHYDPAHSTAASRTMIWGGVTIALFIVFHLLHLTTGTVHPDFNSADIYSNMVIGLSVWYVAAFYIFANIALGLHLYHGVWSVFQTLGINHPQYNGWRRALATIVAVVMSAGYISIPTAILLGVVK
jgi:succinate dehydrogenase / fumarate reductase cytochrome b subunit